MKSKILLLVAMVFASVSLFAQPGGGQGGQRQMPEPKEMATKSVETLTKELKLDKKQEKAVYEIEFKKFTSMSEMMKNRDQSSREKMQAIEKKSDEAIEKLLNADQKEKYAAYKKKQEEERSKRQQSGGERGQRQNN